ncbi:MAG: hypothetical protein KUG78_18285 [Kangiellaceae bacterium]|nr:hypothetical protein [Kangiellaceae bacterium]
MFSRFFNKNKDQVHSNENQTETDDAQREQSANTFGNLSAEKLKSVIVCLNNAEPIFMEAGYVMDRLDVEFGNSPKLTPSFKLQVEIDEARQDAILGQLEDQQLIKFILISLFKSSRMQSLFDNSELFYSGMEIDISSIPSVRTIFKRKEKTAEIIPFNNPS